MEGLSFYQKINLLSLSFLFWGCTEVKRTIGIEKTAPNSLTVSPGLKPIEVPPELGSCQNPPVSSQEVCPLSNAEREILRRIQTLP